jgi:hypothetical protein
MLPFRVALTGKDFCISTVPPYSCLLPQANPLRPSRCLSHGVVRHEERQRDPGGVRAHPLSFAGVRGQFALKGASDHGHQMGGDGAP